jgi:feruloyl-CoA synthase
MTGALHPKGATYRATSFPPPKTLHERLPDGTLLLRSATPLAPIDELGFSDFVSRWAEQLGDTPAFCERDARGEWRSITWAALQEQVRSVAASLLCLDLGPERPLIVLSPNSIEQAILILAADHAGIPLAPVSPAYSLQSQDFARLKGLRALVDPGAIFVQSLAAYQRPIAALDCPSAKVISVEGVGPGVLGWEGLARKAPTAERLAELDARHASRRPQDLARILFTSGSTGVPKGVATSFANIRALSAFMLEQFGGLAASQPVFLDWLPWHHAFGGVLNLGRSVLLGATHYIDDGRPLPGLFERTVRNLREVSPTIFNTVPTAWAMLAAELDRDPVLAQSLFARVVNFGYGGASLSRDVWERIQTAAERTVGERIVFCSGLASTETNGCGTFCSWAHDELDNIGVPMPGTEIKLIPLDGGDGRYEIRVRGAHNFSGYVRHPDLSAAAIDEEGFFRIGDAVRLADPADPGQGLRFAGRVVEDFKLANGTWVRTGAVRVGLVEQCAPFVNDAVVCGHDRSFLGALAWPNIAACRRLSPELAEADPETICRHPQVIATLSRLLREHHKSTSLSIERLLLMAEPPSIDANEIADKGYINQAVARTRRAHLIEVLYDEAPASHIARAR